MLVDLGGPSVRLSLLRGVAQRTELRQGCVGFFYTVLTPIGTSRPC